MDSAGVSGRVFIVQLGNLFPVCSGLNVCFGPVDRWMSAGVCYRPVRRDLNRRFNGREMERAFDKKAPANTTVSYS
jgi:hypothetical protein